MADPTPHRYLDPSAESSCSVPVASQRDESHSKSGTRATMMTKTRSSAAMGHSPWRTDMLTVDQSVSCSRVGEVRQTPGHHVRRGRREQSALGGKAAAPLGHHLLPCPCPSCTAPCYFPSKSGRICVGPCSVSPRCPLKCQSSHDRGLPSPRLRQVSPSPDRIPPCPHTLPLVYGAIATCSGADL